MTTAPEHAAGWTLERTDILMVLWADGKSANAIMRELGGGVSRNGVIGKVHRLKLPMRLSPLGVRKSIEEKLRTSVRRRARRETKPRLKHQPTPRPLLPPPMLIPAWEPLPGSTPIGIMDLSNDTCRWPIGASPFRYCGCEPVAGSSYCGEHRTIATRVIG